MSGKKFLQFISKLRLGIAGVLILLRPLSYILAQDLTRRCLRYFFNEHDTAYTNESYRYQLSGSQVSNDPLESKHTSQMLMISKILFHIILNLFLSDIRA